MDTYLTTDTHKCYAMLSPPHQIYTLYRPSIPTFAMRLHQRPYTPCRIIYSVRLNFVSLKYNYRTSNKGSTIYCKIIYNRKTFNFAYFMGMTNHEFKVPMKYFSSLSFFCSIWNPQIYVSLNMSIVVKAQNFVPMKLHDFTEAYVVCNLVLLPSMCRSVTEKTLLALTKDKSVSL